jgi:hypothetical protein
MTNGNHSPARVIAAVRITLLGTLVFFATIGVFGLRLAILALLIFIASATYILARKASEEYRVTQLLPGRYPLTVATVASL